MRRLGQQDICTSTNSPIRKDTSRRTLNHLNSLTEAAAAPPLPLRLGQLTYRQDYCTSYCSS